jgi:hypothetical protein
MYTGYSFDLLALDIHNIFAAFSLVLAIKISCAAQNKTLYKLVQLLVEMNRNGAMFNTK